MLSLNTKNLKFQWSFKFSIVVFLFSNSLQAAAVSASGRSSSFGVNIEPVIGYEQVYRPTPTGHTSSRITYGGRATLGSDKLAAEIEYLKAEDTESYGSAPQKIVYKDDKVKLGLKTNYSLSNLFYLTGRGGAQAEKNIIETTNNGVLTVENGDFKYHPYAGASIGLRLAKGFSVSVGSTMVFKDTSDLTKNDFQNSVTVGYNIK